MSLHWLEITLAVARNRSKVSALGISIPCMDTPLGPGRHRSKTRRRFVGRMIEVLLRLRGSIGKRALNFSGWD